MSVLPSPLEDAANTITCEEEVSATGRGTIRNPDDFYATPAECVRSLLASLTLPTDGPWLEPCAGNGAIVRAVNANLWDTMHTGVTWDMVELRAEESTALKKCMQDKSWLYCPADYLTDSVNRVDYRVGITNPPYSLASEFARKMRSHCEHVVLLLRLNWLASQKRAWLSEDMPDVYVLPKRPSFTGNGTDATEYAWCHWHGTPRRRGAIERLT